MKKSVIISASCYSLKYYFNEKYSKLPQLIKEQLHQIAVILAQKLHCIFTIGFTDEGDVYFETTAEQDDFNYDEIGARLEISKLERENKELINQLNLWYRVFVLKEDIK